MNKTEAQISVRGLTVAYGDFVLLKTPILTLIRATSSLSWEPAAAAKVRCSAC